MTSKSPSKIAANARAEVARRGLRQSVVAAHLGMDQRAVSRRLLGDVEFSATELHKLANLLEIPVARLLGDEPVSA